MKSREGTPKSSKKLQTRTITEIQTRPVLETQSRSLPDTKPRFILETQSHSVLETQSRSVLETQSHAIMDTRSRLTSDTKHQHILKNQMDHSTSKLENRIVRDSNKNLNSLQANPRDVTSAVVDSRGGKLINEYWGVSLEVPPNAIPEGVKQDIYFVITDPRLCESAPPLDFENGILNLLKAIFIACFLIFVKCMTHAKSLKNEMNFKCMS